MIAISNTVVTLRKHTAPISLIRIYSLQVDFAARPIDPIFKDAREDMKAKDVRTLEHAVKRPFSNNMATHAKNVKESPSPQRHRK